ncbi:MAG: hypothetical protein AAF393_06055 [Pseudomonadota bacterium]
MNDLRRYFPIFFVIGTVAIIFALAGFFVAKGTQAHDIAVIGFIAFGSIVVLFAAAVLYQIGTGSIPLTGIITEPEDIRGENGAPKASLARFQFLIFTFVVAGIFLMLSIEAGQMVDIPNNVLVLIGLSGTGYLAGKVVSNNGIDAQSPETDAKKKANIQAEIKRKKQELADLQQESDALTPAEDPSPEVGE